MHTIMIFAAGEGTRMRPITETTPKPLVLINNKTLLDYTIELSLKNDLNHIVVNSFYLADQIHNHLDDVQKQHPKITIDISHEEERLETGGGIVHALPYLKEPEFFSMNSDVILLDKPNSSSIERMKQMWNPETMSDLLLLQPLDKRVGYDGKGNFDLNSDGKLVMTESEDHPYVFTGIQILSRSLFEDLEVSKFSLRDIYFHERFKNQKERIYGLIHDGDWLHVGTPDAITLAEEALLKAS